MRLLPLLSVLALLAACTGEPAPNTAPQPTATPSATQAIPPPPPPASACPGKIDAPADGLKEVDDAALLKSALGDPGKGALCAGKVFEATKPITVYRVWNKAKPYTQLGRWWSFARPLGPVDAYQKANDICPEWSALDVMSECKVKVGAHIVIGPGQSATCEKSSLPASATNQVFINNDTRDPAKQVVFVDGCTPGAAWP